MDINRLCLGCMSDKGEVAVCPFCGWQEGAVTGSGQQLEPGTILRGKYLLGRMLGQGGFGITYLAWDLDLNLKLAIKEYLPRDFATRAVGNTEVTAYTSANSQAFFDEGREKFLEEARTLASFEDHPNIVSIRDFFRENSTAYFVMNYVEGQTFKEYIESKGGRLEYEDALQIMMPVFDALQVIHKTGILHRDISPDNIFITGKGLVKILDFGAARHALGEHSKSLSVILKPGYAPEEQYRSKGIQGPWTDEYAAAATFYRALTGAVPPDALDRMAGDTMPSPTQFGCKIPTGAEAALMKALSVKAEDRFPDMREFQNAVAAASPEAVVRSQAAGGTGYTSAAPAETPVRPPAPAVVPKTSNLKRNLIVMGAVVLIAVIGFWLIKSKYTPQYSGGMADGKKDGYGVLIMPNGDKYEGEWKNDLQNGKGTFTYANGDKYEGQWVNGNREGTGTFTWADGRKYVGAWKNDLRSGKGVYTWPSGDRYEGEFNDGKLNGRGVYTYANGKVMEGTWQNDNYVGK
ncbi:MAG: protein kinase [Syntrophomonadaceae bacterium]